MILLAMMVRTRVCTPRGILMPLPVWGAPGDGIQSSGLGGLLTPRAYLCMPPPVGALRGWHSDRSSFPPSGVCNPELYDAWAPVGAPEMDSIALPSGLTALVLTIIASRII